MKKAKKYVYPFVFSIGFYVFYIILGTIINTLDFEGYGGLGLFMLIIILWILVATPIFCFKYCKSGGKRIIYKCKWWKVEQSGSNYHERGEKIVYRRI